MKQNLLLLFFLSNSVLASVVLSDVAYAGRYELAKYIPTGIHVDKSPVYPENMELCKAYEANLNSFPQIKEPFACERPINPKLTDFGKPKWRELDASKYVELLVEIERVKYRQYTRPYPFDEISNRNGILKGIRLGHIRLKLAELDVAPASESASREPDGIPEKVLRIERGDPKCNPADEKTRRFPPGREYFIVNDDLTKIEKFRTFTSNLDIFIYKGKVHFDGFHVAHAVDADSADFDASGKRQPALIGKRYEIYVYTPYWKGASPACRYRYVE